MVLLLDTVPLASSNVEPWLPYFHCVVSYLHLRKSVCRNLTFQLLLDEIEGNIISKLEKWRRCYLNLTTDFYFSSTSFNWTVSRSSLSRDENIPRNFSL